MHSTIEAIATQTLSRIDDDRKLRAQCGIEDDLMHVSIVFMEADNPRWADATVRNGEGNYEVYIADLKSSCTCRDYEHRGVFCKHIAAVCFYLLGSTTPTVKRPPFALGDIVQLRGIPAYHGTVVCVSCEFVSVRWEEHGCRRAMTAAYNEVELERAATVEQKQVA